MHKSPQSILELGYNVYRAECFCRDTRQKSGDKQKAAKRKYHLQDYIKKVLLAGRNAIRNPMFIKAVGGFAQNRKREATKFMWDAVD